jgi:hypothetical protein
LREAVPAGSGVTLDPEDWTDLRALGHRMLDDMIDYVATIRERPVWQPIPEAVRAQFRDELPRGANEPADVYRIFTHFIAPYATGNVHPGFMGWVHGGGSAVGMLAEMLAAGLNANLGGRDHIPIEVERQVVDWVRQMFSFPAGASGLFVTGTSMANLMAVLVARACALGTQVRQHGIGDTGARLTAYTSKAAHGCITKAMDIAGFGSDALRCVAVDEAHRIEIEALRERVARDRAVGLKPFLVVASAGSVDIGAIDDLRAVAALCREEKLWFHVDGAFGALGILSADLAPRSKPIRLRLIFTNGARCPTTRGFSWCATVTATRTHSRHLRPICAARRAGSRPAPSGPAISASTCRAGFAR